MSDPAASDWLLVPMEVSALVVGKDADKHFWSEVVPDYAKIWADYEILGPDLVTLFPQGDSSAAPPEGIHLHWWLPEAFGHPLRKNQDAYPYIPNRWLVRRLRYARGSSELRDSESWVVESDFLSETEQPQEGPGRLGQVTVPWSTSPRLCARVGRVLRLQDWAGRSSAQDRLALTAFGSGNPEFAAHYPACKGILGFHDDSPSEQACDVSYLVVGWCSDPEKDLLQGALGDDDWNAILEHLQWSAPGRPTGSRVLCHGAVTRVRWRGPGQDHQSSVPDSTPTVCIGNTSAEALATLLADEIHPEARDRRLQIEPLLTAFQYDLLGHDRVLGDLQDDLYRHRFSSYPGGQGYTITAKAKTVGAAGDSKDAEASSAVLSLPPAVGAKLQTLNSLARDVARWERELASREQDLFTRWAIWAKQYINQRAEPRQLSSRLRAAHDQVRAARSARDTFQDKLKTAHTTLVGLLTEQLPEFELSELAEPPFYRPADPAVLVCGEGMRSSGGFVLPRESDKLRCRVSTEIIRGIWTEIGNAGTFELSAVELFALGDPAPLPSSWDAGPPSELLRDLLHELLLEDALSELPRLDQSCPTSPTAVGNRLTERLSAKSGVRLGDAQREQLMRELAQLLRPPQALPGTPGATMQTGLRSKTDERKPVSDAGAAHPQPLVLGTFSRWTENPWRPLLLKWEVECHPDCGHVDSPGPVVYSGYSLLDPHAEMVLRRRLEALRNRTQAKEKVSDIISKIDSLPVVAQVLGGLHDAFQQLRHGLQLQPIDPAFLLGATVADGPKDALADAMDWQHVHVPAPGSAFLPIRAGQLRINRLHLVDSFGQGRKLIEQDMLRCRLLTSFGFCKDSDEDPLIPLQPRYVQPARLDFRWRALDEGQPVADPLCGWVLPNHLDKSLMIYDAAGKLLGCLQHILRTSLAAGTGGTHESDAKAFFWTPVPGLDEGHHEAFDPDLRAFIAFLLDLGADAGRQLLEAFAEARRDTGRHIEHDSRLSILIGKPLALARTSLRIELMGPPLARAPLAEEGSEAEGWSRDTCGFERVRFPVHLGAPAAQAEGLVGYFVSGARVEEPSPAGAPGILYLRDGLTRESRPLICCNHYLELDAVDVAHLTLLFDPASPVHAHCPLLPRASLTLPNEIAAKVSSIRDVFFQSAPIVGPPGRPTLPRPSDDYGQWSWAARPDVTYWKEYAEIAEPCEGSTLGQPPAELQEGWLKLVMSPVHIAAFWVKEGSMELAGPAAVTLGWLVEGAEELTLSASRRAQPLTTLATWSKQSPAGLPEEHRLLIEGSIRLELTATDQRGNRSTKSLQIDVKAGETHAQ